MGQTTREQELRERYPAIFTHPELLPGEVCVGNDVGEFLELQLDMYHKNGMPSARIGNKPAVNTLDSDDKMYQLFCRPLFVKLTELISAEERQSMQMQM